MVDTSPDDSPGRGLEVVVAIPMSHRNRLLTRDEAMALDPTAKSLAEHAEEDDGA